MPLEFVGAYMEELEISQPLSNSSLENNKCDSYKTMTESHATTESIIANQRSIGYKVRLMLKRLFDIIFSLCVVVIGFIPGLILSIAIVIDTKGSPIYSQVRIGKGGKPFKIYKFRTMVADSDDVEKYLSVEQLEAWKKERKVEDDPRITKLGRVLRASSVDEFPQFINVLLGQISTVGPRVITKEELSWFGDDVDLLLSVSPGITGLWQVSERNDATFESGRRQEIELEYVKNFSIKQDIKIIMNTFVTMFGKNKNGR